MAKKPTYEELEQRVKVLEKESFEQKRAEEYLKHQKRRLESLIEYSSLAIVTLDEGHNIISCNRDFEKLFHFKESEIVGKNLDELIAGQEYIEDALSYTKGTLKGKAIHGSGKRQRKDGAYIDVEFIGVPVIIDGKVIGAYGIYQDISERKRTEEALRESERFFQDVFNAIGDGISVLDLNLKIVRANSWMEEMYSKEGKFAERKCYEVYQKRDTPCPWCPSLKTIETGETHNAIVPYPSEENPTGWIELSSFPLRNAEGDVVGIIEYVKDIAQQKRAEESLRKSEEHYRSIFEDSRDAVYITTRDGKFIDANQPALDLFGYSREEIASVNALQLYVHPNDAGKFEKEIEKRGFLRDYEVTFRKKDGTEMDCLLNTTLRRANDGSILAYQGIIRDMTEHKKLEAQLRQAKKMEAIGTLAGGVAHDFNNILTTIIGNASLALMDVGKDDTLREEIEEIREAGEKAAALTRQLLAFSRKQIIQPEILNFNELLTGIEKMLRRLISEDVELLTIPGPALWQVETDPGQMEQVIMNLVINAKDAMPKGGKLTVETVNVDLDGNYFRKHGIEEQPGSYVMLAVSDTGSGMDKETQEHIFEPFYTTKEQGRGTGLGLSTVYGIIKQNNGFIWVYSEPGQGTTFKVYLPKVKGDAELEEKEQTPVEELGGAETVLIVEDDHSLRKLGRTVLKQKGYKVLEAENGEDALRISKEHGGSIELMITDVVMPKMSGKETAERLQPIYPQMKVIFMSGYTDDAVVRHGVLEPVLNFLEKPFTPEGLARKVREVLDA